MMRTAASDGFTLVELLIATALLALLTLLLFGGLRFGTRAWEAAETTESTETRLFAAQHRLSDLVAEAYPLFIRTSPQQGHVAFDGTSDRLRFLAPSPSGGMNWVTIGTAPWHGRPALVLWTKPELSVAAGDGIATRLADGIDRLDIAYFGAPDPRNPKAWQDGWHDAIVMPLLVRIRARFRDGRTRWPELVIAPHTEVDQGCVFDQLTKYCQGRL